MHRRCFALFVSRLPTGSVQLVRMRLRPNATGLRCRFFGAGQRRRVLKPTLDPNQGPDSHRCSALVVFGSGSSETQRNDCCADRVIDRRDGSSVGLVVSIESSISLNARVQPCPPELARLQTSTACSHYVVFPCPPTRTRRMLLCSSICPPPSIQNRRRKDETQPNGESVQ